MNVRLSGILLLLAVFFAREIQAAHIKQDTIVLYHNEVITGELKELQLGKLTVDTKNVGIIDIKISKVQSINTATDTFRIETVDQMLYYGVLKPAPKEGFVYIVSSRYIRLISVNHITLMTPIDKSFKNRLQGNLSIGFNYTHSSGIGQLNTSTDIYYTTKRVILNLTGSSNATIDTTSFSQDRTDVGLTGYFSWKNNNRWYWIGELDYQRNLQLAVARRYQEVLGGGRKFILTTGMQIMSMLGVSLNQELSTAGVNDVQVEIPLGFVMNFYKFSGPNMQITSKNAFYTNLSQKGRVRYEMNTTFAWELIENFDLSWTFYVSYDRKPPNPDAEKTDYGTVVSLSYKF